MIFWKLVKFSIFLSKYVSISIGVPKNKSVITRTTSSVDFQRQNYLVCFSHSIFDFSTLLWNLFSKVNTYFDNALNSLLFYIFIDPILFCTLEKKLRLLKKSMIGKQGNYGLCKVCYNTMAIQMILSQSKWTF
jgi:hypothetical protein